LGYQAKANEKMGHFSKDGLIKSDYRPAGDDDDAKTDCFEHTTEGLDTGVDNAMVPSFITSGCTAIN
jgi:hypothetical protein